ncbi:MAG: hypothetical protein HFG24_11980 [Anaerotruncus sp.]|nr:hypothetical protein [Anaerotruncus sp.]
MKLRRYNGIAFLAALFLAPVLLLQSGDGSALLDALGSQDQPFQQMESAMKACLPGADFLRRLQISLKYAGGNKQQNGVFISEDMLMLDVQLKSQAIVNANITRMLDFVEQFQRNSYVMLIPTACAVQQSKVPYDTVAPLYNQKQQLLDDVYRRVSGYLTPIDVYPTLRNHQEEYIYYRTDNTTTGLGGYYIYAVAAQKLGLKPRGIHEFSVEHLDYNYYGDLYARSPYREIPPDRISAYSMSKYWRYYTVTHYENDGRSRRYYTLYPQFREVLGDVKDVLLGGVSPIVTIDVGNAAESTRQLLIFGDRSMQSYLPFLLVHYPKVTFVDTASISPSLLEQVDVSRYNQILFAYMADSFIDSDQLSILSWLPQRQEPA